MVSNKVDWHLPMFKIHYCCNSKSEILSSEHWTLLHENELTG